MKADLKNLLDKYFKNIKVDKSLYKKISKFKNNWATKSPIYIEFLGGVHIGVQPIRFSTIDEDNLLNRTLRIDHKELKKELFEIPEIKEIAVDSKGKIKKNTVVANPTYNVLMYLMMRFSKELNSRDAENAIRDCFSIMSYKILGSIVYRYFQYDLDINVANAVFEKMSKKFLIKQFGSWQAVIDYKSDDVYNGIHKDKVLSFNTDGVIYAIADIQNKYRSLVKNIYVLIEEVNEENSKISTTSTLKEDEDGGLSVADITDTPDKYTNYINSIVYSKSDFVKDDLMELVTDIMSNVSIEDLKANLELISSMSLKDPNIKKELLPMILETSLAYLKDNDIVSIKDSLEDSIDLLRRYWSSSRTKSKNVSVVKNKMIKITIEATGKKTSWVIAAINIATITYIFIRSVSIKSYQQ